MAPSTRPDRRPWTGSSGSLVRVFAYALIGLAVLLAIDVGPLVFDSIPWRARWWMGEGLFVASLLFLAARSLRLPPPARLAPDDPSRRSGRNGQRLAAWGLQAVTLSFAYPLFARPGYWAHGDWDLHFQWYEAIRESILRWREFPWWNPWTCGGFPLAADPQVGLVSIDTPLVLLLGTSAGLRWATVAYMMLAVEGTRRLARLWFDDPWVVAAVAAIYGWNGAIIIYTVSGHALPMCYAFLPWMLLHAFQLDRGPGQAVKLGLWTAASVLTIIQYQTAYAMIITFFVVLRMAPARDGGELGQFARNVGLATGVFLALAGWRLVLTGQVLADYPRVLWTWANGDLGDVLRAAIARDLPPPRLHPRLTNFDCEGASYIGWLPVLAAIASLKWGLRWWHVMAAVCYAMGMGSVRADHPSFWVKDWPAFSTMHVVGRWRIPAILGIALAAGGELQKWRVGPRFSRGAAVAVIALILADLACYAHQSLPTAFGIPPAEEVVPEPPTRSFVNLRDWVINAGNLPTGYISMRQGYGQIMGYCPQLGLNRDRKTVRLWRGHPDYVGEFWTGKNPIEPIAWSPNRIVLRVGPNQAVEINQNPGSWWLVNGARIAPSLRCAEPKRRFIARADNDGWLRLEISPPGLGRAAMATVAGIVLTLACAGTGRRSHKPRSS